MSTFNVEGYSIAPIAEEDLPTIANFLWISKQQLTINRVLWNDWPNEAAQRLNYQNAVDMGFKDPSNETFKVTSDSTREIVGHVLCRKTTAKPNARPAPKDAASALAENDEIPPYFNAPVLKAVTAAVNEIGEEWDGVEHFELTHIFILQPHRKYGIGSSLVNLCIGKARNAGLPLSLQSEPAAHDFFLKRGFKDTKHVDFNLAKWAPPCTGFGLFRLSGMVLRM